MKRVCFCENNFALGTDKVKEELETIEGFEVESYGCLGHCAECAESMFAVVNDEFVTGDNEEELLDNVKNQ